jgi:hypothetical protein
MSHARSGARPPWLLPFVEITLHLLSADVGGVL